MQDEQTKNKIITSLNICLANLPDCQTLNELAVPAEIMIRQVAALIKPDCDVEFPPLRRELKESLDIEESKEESASDVTFWMNQLTDAIKVRE